MNNLLQQSYQNYISYTYHYNGMNQTKYFVIMTDKCFSGWGRAKGKINKYIIECESLEQAKIVKENAKHRGDMRYININTRNRYKDNSRYLISIEKAEDTNFIIPGYFAVDKEAQDVLYSHYHRGSK